MRNGSSSVGDDVMIPYVECFLGRKESRDLFEFCRALPYVRPLNPRNNSSFVRKVSYGCYSVVPTSRTGMTVHGGGADWLDKAPPQIKELAARLSAYTGKDINYLSLLGYVDERDHIGWHNHREDLLNEDQSVVVVSLGEPRILSLRPAGSKDRRLYEHLETAGGSLYTLPHSYNTTHEHAVLDDRRPRGLRISVNCKTLSPADLARLVPVPFVRELGPPRIYSISSKQYPPDAVYVGRACGGWPSTPFGNHGRLDGEAWKAEVARLMSTPGFPALVEGLRGKDLLCWCKPNAKDCHARAWLELANLKGSVQSNPADRPRSELSRL